MMFKRLFENFLMVKSFNMDGITRFIVVLLVLVWSDFWLLCCRRNLLNVLDFLKRPNASTLVSGTRDRVNLHDKFRSAIETSFPGDIDRLEQKAEEKKALEKKVSFWDSVSDSKVGAFKFSF